MNNISREQLEAMIVTTIKNKLEHGKISGDRAKEIAQMVLGMLPKDITPEQLAIIIPQLDDQIGELSDVVLTVLRDKDERFRSEELSRVRTRIQAIINKTINI